ncbi:MAG: YfhE family protein [Planococcus sp. (in: firmicutes)]|uniref:YfhE family protein n=1 Tax=Planococcus halocryophilus TaxID=1215089 RepID=UPI001F0D0518|nr:YfhE family protein [Planococcus halocryophilus]MCH4826442.1 YfhE family protein [Planococcus halocryophilus]
MSSEKEPHEKLSDKDLDLTSAQEVHYNEDFKKADKAAKEDDQQKNKEDENSNDN